MFIFVNLDVQRASATSFTPKVNMQSNFSSADSLISTSAGATTTNTTSNRTTRSGSDLFKSDSSGFSKPLVPPGKWRSTVSTSTSTDDQEASPAFTYTLSLSVLRHFSKVEKSDLVEFKVPDFTKTVTWQVGSETAPGCLKISLCVYGLVFVYHLTQRSFS